MDPRDIVKENPTLKDLAIEQAHEKTCRICSKNGASAEVKSKKEGRRSKFVHLPCAKEKRHQIDLPKPPRYECIVHPLSEDEEDGSLTESEGDGAGDQLPEESNLHVDQKMSDGEEDAENRQMNRISPQTHTHEGSLKPSDSSGDDGADDKMNHACDFSGDEQQASDEDQDKGAQQGSDEDQGIGHEEAGDKDSEYESQGASSVLGKRPRSSEEHQEDSEDNQEAHHMLKEPVDTVCQRDTTERTDTTKDTDTGIDA